MNEEEREKVAKMEKEAKEAQEMEKKEKEAQESKEAEKKDGAGDENIVKTSMQHNDSEAYLFNA